MSDAPPLVKLKALCPMRHREFTFGDQTLTVWTACDLDPLLDRLMHQDPTSPELKDERMPYWAELWPSSLLMAEVMTNHAPKLPEGDFLEMGCGPALPSVMAARLGKRGLATDYLPEARWLAELNLTENKVCAQVPVAHLDWREPLDSRFGWILAGDIAYETRNFRPIADCWSAMLAPGGEIWLGEPGRSVARDFFHLLSQENWQVETIGRKERLRVHRITRRFELPTPPSVV